MAITDFTLSVYRELLENIGSGGGGTLLEIINEKPFQTLALVGLGTSIPYLTFLDNERYANLLKDENISMLLTTPSVMEKLNNHNFGVCICENPRLLFFILHNWLVTNTDYGKKETKTSIGLNCNISNCAVISENNVIIGNNVIIEEFAVIRENTVIGDNSIIRAGTIIGGEGFEFKRSNGNLFGVKHSGGVVIGKNVEIQYNTCIDKAVYPWDNTVIDDYSKIDNLVHIGHAVKIDKNVMIVANCGIGGRTVIKENTWIGFGSTITNGITIGKNARANIGSVVTRDVSDNASVTGNFAIEHLRFIQNLKKSVQDEWVVQTN